MVDEQTEKKENKAQAMVEFAIVIPIVMVLVMGIFEFGRLIFIYSSISAASREAARYGAGVGDVTSGTNLYNDCSGIKAAAMRIGRFAGIKTSDIHIYHDAGPGTTQSEYCTNPSDTVPFQQDDRISVKVDTQFTPIVPLVNLSSFILHSQNSHTIFAGAQVDAAFTTITTGGQTCDTTKYILTQSNPLGPSDTFTIRNISGTDRIIKEMVVYLTTSKTNLLQLTDPNGNTFTLSGNMVNMTPITWNFPNYINDATTPDLVFTLTYTGTLDYPDQLTLSLYLDTEETCAFGNWSQ